MEYEKKQLLVTFVLLFFSSCRRLTACLTLISAIPPAPLGAQHRVCPVSIFLIPSFLCCNTTIHEKSAGYVLVLRFTRAEAAPRR
ncbi:hypothetical protein Anapl_07335 [Anas platyrhynchos]|uniref:Uncharacterized protein n=1 Tax=Anas platyrhynchos TaxID=8839 RepID=R0JPA1_ANAPL|nr:hypothetical protein Anapl_07335 [Anas platyrhynchos]